jgi:hypothetical protein
VARLPLAGTLIPAASIPASVPPGVPFIPHAAVLFGMRTSAGRLAKVKAYRDLFAGGALRLNWVTWDTPIPRLEIRQRCSVVERGEVTESITSDCRFCRSSPVRWCCVFEAIPRLMPFPIDLQWCLCGVVITDGEGELDTPTGRVAYRLRGRHLVVQATEMGQDLRCELCVSAIDGRGQEQYECVRIDRAGLDVQCRPCVPTRQRYDLVLLPVKTELAGWQAAVGPSSSRIAAAPVK